MEPVQKYNLRKRQGLPLHLQLQIENVAVPPKTKRQRVLPPPENAVTVVEIINHGQKQPANSKQRRKPPARNNTKKPESQDQDKGTKNKRNNKRPKPATTGPETQEVQTEPLNLPVVELMEVVAPEADVDQNGTNSQEGQKEQQHVSKKVGSNSSTPEIVDQNGNKLPEGSKEGQKKRQRVNKKLGPGSSNSTPEIVDQNGDNLPEGSKEGQKKRQQVNEKVGTGSSNSSASQKTSKKTPTTSLSLDATQIISSPRSEQQVFMDTLTSKLNSYLSDIGNQSEVKAEHDENGAQSSDEDSPVASGSNDENGAQSLDEDSPVASGSNVEEQIEVSPMYDQSKIRNVESALLAGHELNISTPLPSSTPASFADISTLADGNIKIVEREGNKMTINCKLCCKNYTVSVQSMKKAVEKHMQKVHNTPTVEGTRNGSFNVSFDRSRNSIGQGEVVIVKVEDNFPMAQTEFNHLLMNFVITKRLFTTITDEIDFKLFIGTLVKGTAIKMPTPQQLLELLEMRYDQSVAKLQQQLKYINHVCISADLFTKDCRTYLAIMCHYIDPLTFQRRSKALVFRKYPQNRQFTNSDMYSEVREIVLNKFGITQDKIVRFMTNSVLALSKKRATERDLEGTVFLMNLNCNNNFKISSMKFADRQDATNQQCYAYKLERLAAHYVLHCLDGTDASLKLMQFWDALQNSPNIEATFVDTIFCSATLQCPQSKKYHLSHLTLQDVLECVETTLKLKATLNQAMVDLNMSPFGTEDFTFFEDLTLVIKPVLQSLLVMRKKENCYLGIILPTLRALQFNLKQVRKMSSKCEELRVSIMGGIERRFTNIIDVKSQASHPLVLATMSLPQLKQTWLRDVSEENRDFCKGLLIKEVAKLDAQFDDSDPELVSENDEFFDALTKKNEQLRSEQSTSEVSRFIEDDRRKVEIINQYPRVKRVFLKYNTFLPTSAPLANFLCDSKNRLLTPFICSFPEKYFEMLFVLRNEMETETN